MIKKNALILVIDDFKSVRRILRGILADLGFTNIIEAEDGQEAYSKYKESTSGESPVEIIFSDWNMPKLDGHQLLLKIREENKSIPFFMITSESDLSAILSAINSGVTDYIVKPFSKEIILSKLSKINENNA